MIMIHKIFSKIEKGASFLSLVCIASLSPVVASGADFYVDASATAGGDGSQAAPFQTIKAAVDAANLLPGTPSTIHVASGTYNITAASDFATINVPDLTITAANPSSKPVVAIAANLSTVQNNPVVFAAPQGSDRLTVANLKFTFSYAGDKNVAGNSFGQSGKLFRSLQTTASSTAASSSRPAQRARTGGTAISSTPTRRKATMRKEEPIS